MIKKLLIIVIVSITLWWACIFAQTDTVNFSPIIQKLETQITNKSYGEQKTYWQKVRTKIIAMSLQWPNRDMFAQFVTAIDTKIQTIDTLMQQDNSSIKNLVYSDLRLKVLNQINDIRTSTWLQTLQLDDDLNLVAEVFVRYLARTNDFAHETQDGIDFQDRIRTSGYGFALAWENLAKGYTDIQDLILAWMVSPLHRDNILNPKFKDMGIAYKNGYRVQLFGLKISE